MRRRVVRVGDQAKGPQGFGAVVAPGIVNVTVEGRPAAATGDVVTGPGTPGAIGPGAGHVLVNGRSLAGMGHEVTGGGRLTTGSETVTIGESIVGVQHRVMRLAASEGVALVARCPQRRSVRT